jgi:hypothetical protein
MERKEAPNSNRDGPDRTGFWPNGLASWRDWHVVVTAGRGLLGSFVVEKLIGRQPAEVLAAEGILLATERCSGGAPIDLGSALEISIEDLLDAVARLTGFEGGMVWEKPKPNGQPRRRLDVSRARERFGFVSQTPFGEGLQRTLVRHRSTSAGGG